MKALTVQQPYADAIAHGPKRVENRTRKTYHRGLLAIHAGLAADWLATDRAWAAAGLAPYVPRAPHRRWTASLVLGAVVAVADVTACHWHSECREPNTRGGTCRAMWCSEWSAAGQYHWVLENVRSLPEPVPCKGALGLWTVPDDVESAVMAQLGEKWQQGSKQMADIRNTTRAMQEDPAESAMLLLTGMDTGSPGSFIERQERDGQRQLVNSDRLPSDMGDQAAYEALGFTFGPVDEDDPLFRPATLPPGWKREASDHAMGSHIVDTLGRQRVSIFYKAAFYDRKAHMNLVSLSWYVTCAVEYDGKPLIFDDEWATRDAVLAAMAESRDIELGQAADFRRYAADTANRDEQNRAGCARIAGEKEATAAKYDAAMKALPDGN